MVGFINGFKFLSPNSVLLIVFVHIHIVNKGHCRRYFKLSNQRSLATASQREQGQENAKKALSKDVFEILTSNQARFVGSMSLTKETNMYLSSYSKNHPNHGCKYLVNRET